MVFQDSSYAQDGWPSQRPAENPLDITKKALRVLFSLLHGAQLDFDQLIGRATSHKVITPEEYTMGLCVAVCACAYAEFGDCFDMIRSGAARAIKSTPNFWTYIYESPGYYMALACKLQDRELYYDALRHRAAQAHELKDWEAFAIDAGIPAEELQEYYGRGHECMKERVEQMKHDIHALQLNTTGVKCHGWSSGFTTFLNALQFKDPDRSDNTKANERFGFLARAIFGQWYTQQLYGVYVYEDVRGNPRALHSRYLLIDRNAKFSTNFYQAVQRGHQGDRASSRFPKPSLHLRIRHSSTIHIDLQPRLFWQPYLQDSAHPQRPGNQSGRDHPENIPPLWKLGQVHGRWR